jgi:hypothetical protein
LTAAPEALLQPALHSSCPACSGHPCREDAASGCVSRTDGRDKPGNAAEERRAVAYAIAHIEVKVGARLGIKDRAGMQFTASGDPELLAPLSLGVEHTRLWLAVRGKQRAESNGEFRGEGKER